MNGHEPGRPASYGPVSPGTGQIPSVPPPVFSGDVAPLDQPPGVPPPQPYGVPPPQPPGVGPPYGQAPQGPPPCGQPPPVVGGPGMAGPPKKNGSGMVIGVVVGLVLLLLLCGGGAAVWFFVPNDEGGSGDLKTVFPTAHERQVEQAPPTVFVYDSDIDICASLPTDTITASVPFTEGPSPENSDASVDGTGMLFCSAVMRGTEEHNGSVPGGGFSLALYVRGDVPSAIGDYEDHRDRVNQNDTTELEVTGVGEQATALYTVGNNVHDVYVFFQNGNIGGYADIGWNAGDAFVPPDTDVMVDILVDMLNAVMLDLA